MLAYRYKDDGIYEGEATCQRDPLESQLKGADVWLLPGNCTWTMPPEEKEGFDRKFDKEKGEWEYVEKKKDPEPEPYVPTEKDKLNQELWEYKNKLQSLDYIGVKIATGRATIEEYADEIALMNEYANKVNEIQAKIDALEETTEEAE